ncbi:GNAT family N-acetyltransferase [Selenomonas ruminantium]|uniref:Acetyltransferase (GNAT) domain-containing protein n=1 Tax=Selenomonas ruminantium TaxID=971 RepID=A0A1K1PJW1_SELRU|nr:GNAT family N-acetyltransferase [Selenomonas ruminantium]SFW47733.1 Acetyltransferase (GNAT) domain-containing protein [Selenomonas ruminantium]
MIVPYKEEYAPEWDKFVLNNSINGNFLQTRNFYSYHPKGRFQDASLMFYLDDELAAVLPANVVDDGKVLLAHQGSTFGGIVVGRKFANTVGYNWIFKEMTDYFQQQIYEKVELRMHSNLYSPSNKSNELLDYYFQLNNFAVRSEIGFFMAVDNLTENYVSNFEKLKKRKLNKAKKQGLTFRKLDTDIEVHEFFEVLSNNMKKFDTEPVHTEAELCEFKNNRLKDIVSFYGVYHGKEMVAGSMVFNFCDKKVFHTQYLASRQDKLEYCPNEFLYVGLIEAARAEGYKYLSYGTASLNHGMVYNESLGRFKEGFNTDTYVNRCYIWQREKA